MPRKPLTNDEIESFRTSYCETAYALYQQDDYAAVTMRGIAKAMDCSPMMAYRYFDNKEAVFASLRAILFHRLADALEAVPNSLSPLNYFRELGVAYAGFAHEQPHAYRLLYMIHNHQAQTHPETERAQKRTQIILFDATRKAIESGVLHGDSTLMAHSYWAWIHGLLSLELANQLTHGAGFDELFQAMLDSTLKANNQRDSK